MLTLSGLARCSRATMDLGATDHGGVGKTNKSCFHRC